MHACVPCLPGRARKTLVTTERIVAWFGIEPVMNHGLENLTTLIWQTREASTATGSKDIGHFKLLALMRYFPSCYLFFRFSFLSITYWYSSSSQPSFIKFSLLVSLSLSRAFTLCFNGYNFLLQLCYSWFFIGDGDNCLTTVCIVQSMT